MQYFHNEQINFYTAGSVWMSAMSRLIIAVLVVHVRNEQINDYSASGVWMSAMNRLTITVLVACGCPQ